jgi:hypothetical protein
MGAVADAFAKNDPKGFLDSVGTITSPKAKEEGIASALKAMAAQDPKAAMAWAAANQGMVSNALLQQRQNAILEGWAQQDPNAAYAQVMSMPAATRADQQAQTVALNAMMSGMADAGNWGGATAMIQGMTGQQQTQANNSLVAAWAAASPEDAAAYVATLPANQQTRDDSLIAAQWAQSDPAGAAAWALQTDAALQANAANGGAAGGRGGRGAGGGTGSLATVMATWSSSDLDASGQFLQTLQDSPDKDAAVEQYVLNAASVDPTTAMQWASTITNTRMQQAAVAQAAAAMTTDELNAFIANNPALTQAQTDQLIADNQGGGFGGPGGGGNFGAMGGGPGGGRRGGGAAAAGPTVVGTGVAGRGGRRGGGGGG